MNRDEGAYQLSPIWTQVISTSKPGRGGLYRVTLRAYRGFELYVTITFKTLKFYLVSGKGSWIMGHVFGFWDLL